MIITEGQYPANGVNSCRGSLAVWLLGLLKRTGSLRLTVFCLAIACVLVFVGTLAQAKIGIYEAERLFFTSLFVTIPVPRVGLRIPIFPGGYLIGLILLLNLGASLVRYPALRCRYSLLLLHLGIGILLVGQVVSDFVRRESILRLVEGEAKNYSEDGRRYELALVDYSLVGRDRIYAVPDSWLRSGRLINDKRLPLQIKVLQFWPNSRLIHTTASKNGKPQLTTGQSPVREVSVEPLPLESNSERRNMPSALIELRTHEGKGLGQWLVSSWLDEQPVCLDGKKFGLSLRLRRYYKPYTIQLIDFEHVRYPGSDIPKSFSSRVRLIDPERQVDREVLIYMNHPLRYRGETLYQAGYDPSDDRVTILQVVRNPVWISPYVSCGIIALGLVLHFGQKLIWRHR